MSIKGWIGGLCHLPGVDLLDVSEGGCLIWMTEVFSMEKHKDEFP